MTNCANCGRLLVDDAQRGLCPACYSCGAIRSCFGADGQRLADPPPAEPPDDDESEYAPPPIVVTVAEPRQTTRRKAGA
jgi:hypothetical protein